MKILIASDLHGSTRASEKIVQLDQKFNFEKVILLGDINYSGARNVPPLDYYPIFVCENLLKIKDKLILIRGNCDSRVDEFVLGVKFKDIDEIKLNGHKIILTHGDLYDEKTIEFASNFGLAFQIRDDLINVINSDKLKSASDLDEGIYNAPMILSDKIDEGIEKTKDLLNNYVNCAKQCIGDLETSVYKFALTELLELLEDV